ncbi:MAG: hypothetical protein JSS30_08160 [Verrucomicrobia bacterium]|nr:hypothetical protein [Verrucomicrobiota bacterium]
MSNVYVNGVHLLPYGLFDEAAENRPNLLNGREVKLLDCDPKQLHKKIRDFRGTAKQLSAYCDGISDQNKKGEKLKTPFFYSAIIRHGTRSKGFLDLSFRAFMEAERTEQLNAVVCNNFMTVAKQAGDFEKVQLGFKTALKVGCYDANTFNIYMNAAGTERFDEVQRAYFLAIEKGKNDLCTANTLIDLAGKSGNYELARQTFDRVEKDADVFTYSAMIKIYGAMGNFAEARRVFEAAKAKAAKGEIELNEYVIGCYMTAANKHGQYEEAINAFKIAPIYNNFINYAYEFAAKKLNIINTND